jgi:hypothetical protein
LSANYANAGARILVVAGVVENQRELDRYVAAVGCEISVVRLRAPLALIEQRLRARHKAYDAEELEWHLARAPELDAILDASSLPMAEIDATAPPREVAAAVLRACARP